jgi:hypothetical protein
MHLVSAVSMAVRRQCQIERAIAQCRSYRYYPLLPAGILDTVIVNVTVLALRNLKPSQCFRKKGSDVSSMAIYFDTDALLRGLFAVLKKPTAVWKAFSYTKTHRYRDRLLVYSDCMRTWVALLNTVNVFYGSRSLFGSIRCRFGHGAKPNFRQDGFKRLPR